MHAQAGCQAVAGRSWQLRSAWANAIVDGRQGGETLSCSWRRSAEAAIPGPMSPESVQPTRMVPASLLSRQALIFQGRYRQVRLQIELTRFPVGVGLSASPSGIPVPSLPDGPCGARRRIDPAAGACGKIVRPGRPSDRWPTAIRFDLATREP